MSDRLGRLVRSVFVVMFVAVFGFMLNAQAAMDFTDVTVGTADIFTFAGIVLAAIGSIWGIRKLVKLGNRS